MATGERFSHRFGLDFQTFDDPLTEVEQGLFDSSRAYAERYASLDQDKFAILFEGGIVCGKRIGDAENDPHPTWEFDIKHGTLESPKRTHVWTGYRQITDPATFEAQFLPLLLISPGDLQGDEGEVKSWKVFTETPENINAMSIINSGLTVAISHLENQ